ncbi:MAG TPA: hypothetical protein VFY97_11170 [Rhodanobacteraceae bacterium]|nr:hypothetical protein [Rhodanobacteraceae bacterium]
MKLRTLTFTMVFTLAGFTGIACAGPAHAIMQPADTIELLSRATGLTVHDVELALGPSSSEYPVRYESANRRFRQAVGRGMYEQIMGQGVLTARQVRDLAAMAESRPTRRIVGNANPASK